MAWIDRLVVRHGTAVLVGIAVLSGILAYGYLTLEWTNDPEVITLRGSGELAHYRDFVRRWGSDELIVLGYETQDAFAPAELRRLRALTDALFDVPGVRWVSSLDTVVTVDVGPFGPFDRPLVPDDVASARDLRSRALASPFVRDALVSSDGSMLLLAVQLEGSELDNTDLERRVLGDIEALLERPEFAGISVVSAGSPVFSRALADLNTRDNVLFTPLALAIVGLAVALLFRRILPSLLVLAVIAATVLWTQGLMGWLGVPMNITTSLLPPLLMVIGAADAVHILDAYVGRLASGSPRAAALRWTLKEVGPSCFWTSLTTALGFASLGLVRIESVQTFGLFAILGVGFAFFHATVLLPALMLRVPLEPSEGSRRDWAVLRALATLAERPAWALALLVLSVGAGAAAWPRIEVSTHDGEFFRPTHPINVAYRQLERHFGGVTPFELEIAPPTQDDLRSVRALAALDDLQDALAAFPELTRGTSLVDLVQTASPSVELGDAEAAERALFLTQALAPEEVARFVHDDPPRLRISARALAMSSARSDELVSQVRERASQVLPAGWSARPTGLVPVFSQMEQYLVEGQVRSYAAAFLSICAVLVLVLRSWRVAVIAALANLLPIALVAAVMGFGGIRLDVATVMVASVAMGIIVDDTIHLTRAYQRGLARGLDGRGAMRRALWLSGRAVVTTSVVLVSGFAALALSSFQPTAHFGLLVCSAIAVALVGDLIVLPAGLLAFHPVDGKEWTWATEDA